MNFSVVSIIFSLIALLSPVLISADTSLAEVWRCESTNGQVLYTRSPIIKKQNKKQIEYKAAKLSFLSDMKKGNYIPKINKIPKEELKEIQILKKVYNAEER